MLCYVTMGSLVQVYVGIVTQLSPTHLTCALNRVKSDVLCKSLGRRLAVIRERSQLAASLLSQAQQLRLKENVCSHVETC